MPQPPLHACPCAAPSRPIQAHPTSLLRCYHVYTNCLPFTPGLYAGRVKQSLGTACVADVCDTGQGWCPANTHAPQCCFAPAGLYAGRVTQSLGSACLADVCGRGQGHR